jgi:hypothetical protein
MKLNLIKTVRAAAINTTFPNEPLIANQFRDVKGILGAILNVVFYVGIAMTIIFLIIGGIRYTTSGGDETKIAAARGAVTNAIIGFVVVIGAFTVRFIVENLLGITNMPNEVLPSF